MRHELFPVDELPRGSLREARVDGVAVVVVRTPDGALHALRAVCPHKGAPLARGRLQPLTTSRKVGERELSHEAWVIRCPWHEFEFDIDTGACIADRNGLRVKSYPVSVEAGMVVVER